MSAGHSDPGPELRQLAQAILDRLDPAVRAAAARATNALSGPGRCQQVWCPVCALAALVTGEEHPLLTVVAEHSVALMNVIRTMAADQSAAGDTTAGHGGDRGATDRDTGEHDTGPNGNGRYQNIPIVVEPVTGDAPDAPVDCP